MIRKYSLVIAAAIFLLSSCTESTEQKTNERIAGIVEELRQTMINPDSVKLDMLVSDHLSYGHSSGKVEDKVSFINTLLKGESDFVEIDLSEQTIVAKNETAIVRHILKGKTLDKGVEGEVNLKILLVFTKENGAWRLLARQAVKNS